MKDVTPTLSQAETVPSESPQTNKRKTKEDLYYKNIFKNEAFKSNNLDSAELFHLNQEIVDEVKKYSLLVKDKKFLENCENSPEFWNDNATKFPCFYKTSLILCSINSSSTFIERFFSICGVIKDSRRGNMDEELFYIRALLACNFDTLNKLKMK